MAHLSRNGLSRTSSLALCQASAGADATRCACHACRSTCRAHACRCMLANHRNDASQKPRGVLSALLRCCRLCFDGFDALRCRRRPAPRPRSPPSPPPRAPTDGRRRKGPWATRFSFRPTNLPLYCTTNGRLSDPVLVPQPPSNHAISAIQHSFVERCVTDNGGLGACGRRRAAVGAVPPPAVANVPRVRGGQDRWTASRFSSEAEAASGAMTS